MKGKGVVFDILLILLGGLEGAYLVHFLNAESLFSPLSMSAAFGGAIVFLLLQRFFSSNYPVKNGQ